MVKVIFFIFRERENKMEYVYEFDNLSRQLELLRWVSEIVKSFQLFVLENDNSIFYTNRHPVWPDLAIFVRTWCQNFLAKVAQINVNFLGSFKNVTF